MRWPWHERCALPQSREVSLEQGERQGDGGSRLGHTGRKRLAEHLLAQVGNVAHQARRLDGPRRRDAQVEIEQPIVGGTLLPVQHAFPEAGDGGGVGEGVAIVIDVAMRFAKMAGARAHGDRLPAEWAGRGPAMLQLADKLRYPIFRQAKLT